MRVDTILDGSTVTDTVLDNGLGNDAWNTEVTASYSDFAGEVIGKIAGDVFNRVGRWAIDLMVEYIQTPTNVENSFDFISTLMYWSRTGSCTLATVLFVFKLLTAMKKNLTEEKGPNYAEICGSFVVSVALIYAIPYVVQNFLIVLNNQIIISLGKMFPFSFDQLFKTSFVTISGPGGIWIAIIIWIVLLICFILIALAGMIRFVELVILLAIGPIIATTYITRPNTLQTYWTECMAVVFTQSIHFLLVMILINFLSLSTNSLKNLFMAIAVALVAIKGPHVLRKHLHSTGIGGVTSSLGRVATYRAMVGLGKF